MDWWPRSRRRSPPAAAASPALAELTRWESARPLTVDALTWNLEFWLAQLRPDAQLRTQQTRVWIIAELTRGDGLLVGGDGRIDLCIDHPLVQRAMAAPTAEKLAWLLLAIYAHINAVSGLVSNADEARFHVIIGEALRAGRLQVLVPGSTELP